MNIRVTKIINHEGVTNVSSMYRIHQRTILTPRTHIQHMIHDVLRHFSEFLLHTQTRPGVVQKKYTHPRTQLNGIRSLFERIAVKFEQ